MNKTKRLKKKKLNTRKRENDEVNSVKMAVKKNK